MSTAPKLPKSWLTLGDAVKTEVAGVEGVFSEKTIGLMEAVAPDAVLQLALERKLFHICQKDNPFCDNDVETAALMIADPKQFMDTPLSAVLDPQNVSLKRESELAGFRVQFSSISEKHTVLEDLKNYLLTFSKSTSLHSEILLVADELFTNAVFNSHRSGLVFKRGDTSVSMADSQYGVLKAGVIGDRFVLVCSDSFGTLELPKLVKRMKDCYTEGVRDMMNMGDGGAGIGSYLVYSAATSYFAGVERNKRTVIAWSVPLQMSSRKRVALAKNVHFIGF